MKYQKVEELLLEGLLLVLVLLNAMNIVSRYVLHQSIGQTFELLTLLSAVLYWIGIGTAEKVKAHLGMNFVVLRLPESGRNIAETFRKLAIVFFLVMIFISSCIMVVNQIESGSTTAAMTIPRWVFSLSMPVGAAVMLKRVLSR